MKRKRKRIAKKVAWVKTRLRLPDLDQAKAAVLNSLLGNSRFDWQWGHVRTVPVPDWVKRTVDEWVNTAGATGGKLFRCVCRAGTAWGDSMTEKVVWHVVKEYAAKLGLSRVAPHGLRRSCARLCHAAGGELEQIQFLLGHVSVQATEGCLGCKQRLKGAVNGQIGIEPVP
jgi:integrase